MPSLLAWRYSLCQHLSFSSLDTASGNPSPQVFPRLPQPPSFDHPVFHFTQRGGVAFISWLPAHFYDGSSSYYQKLIYCLFLLQLKQAGITRLVFVLLFHVIFCSLDISGMHINRGFSVFSSHTLASLSRTGTLSPPGLAHTCNQKAV